MAQFMITMGKGFRMSFDNGWEVSVQFGPDNYCENRTFRLEEKPYPNHPCMYGCANAEVAVFNPQGEMVNLTPHDKVEGWMTPDRVLELMVCVAKGAFVPADEFVVEDDDEEHIID